MSAESSPFSLWSLPQPLFVLGSTLLAAYTVRNPWIDIGTFTAIVVFGSIALVLILERFVPKRRDWLLNWKELLEDAFWLFCTYAIWIPIYDEAYDTPISKLFERLRDSSGFPYTLEADSVFGLFVAAMIGIFAMEFIGYWAHRLQHRFMFLWRIHATHHHITKMSAARADRTHPLEFLGLNLGGAISLAFLGASADVIAVLVIFRGTTVHIVHSNLPLRSGIYGLLFTTAEWHQTHHSKNYKESNTNFGCTVIFWDRLFGTFNGGDRIETIGNGTGKPLSILTQLSIPFRSNESIRSL